MDFSRTATPTGAADFGATLSEHRILEHIKDALRVTVEWRAPAVSADRKKTSVSFTLQSFCRHMERLMAIEEEGGYLSDIVEQRPRCENRVVTLATDHRRFRERILLLKPRLEAMAHADPVQFEAACEEIRELLDEVDRHDRAEIELLQEMMLTDVGGEG
ncbi:hypothetical protein Mal64_31160 [Pseudobythopirellula maris]|uniref:Hemerythrin-like domain-containing protein n=1 Tax=Pseudobythopirellula maris TaxID=2527991 RepID=A0A5C5ZJL2_9BACT|nr:hypothetical protein [Pseudobythopirellula maris]TWT87574.1 hypothetical protein Mal64_31160 [Pseudobythopirellula maris]